MVGRAWQPSLPRTTWVGLDFLGSLRQLTGAPSSVSLLDFVTAAPDNAGAGLLGPFFDGPRLESMVATLVKRSIDGAAAGTPLFVTGLNHASLERAVVGHVGLWSPGTPAAFLMPPSATSQTLARPGAWTLARDTDEMRAWVRMALEVEGTAPALSVAEPGAAARPAARCTWLGTCSACRGSRASSRSFGAAPTRRSPSLTRRRTPWWRRATSSDASVETWTRTFERLEGRARGEGPRGVGLPRAVRARGRVRGILWRRAVGAAVVGDDRQPGTGEHAFGCKGAVGKMTHRHDRVHDAILAHLRQHAHGRIPGELEPVMSEYGMPLAPGLTEAQAATATLMHADILITNTEDGAWTSPSAIPSTPTRRRARSRCATPTPCSPASSTSTACSAQAATAHPMEGHLGVVHLPFESYGGTLKSVFTWYERIGRLLYPGELRADGTMSDPGRRARGLRALVRQHVLAQEGSVGGHARGGDGLVAVRGRPQAPP